MSLLDPPLELLHEPAGLPALELPDALAAAYPGTFGFPARRTFANFVQTLDGVTAIPSLPQSNRLIAGGSAADRFVMGLLRACADTVLVGAGTFRKTRGALFRADAIHPDGASAFAELRERLGLAPHPRLVVVTRSGAVDPAEPALDGALVVTSRAGEAALRGRVSPNTEVVALGADTLLLGDVVALLRKRGTELLLTEGGPSLFAEAVRAKLVDELFVTKSPALFGRYPNDRRKSLADGFDLSGVSMDLLSVRRHGSYLFLRYAL